MSFFDIWMKIVGWEVKYHIDSLEVDCMGAAYCYWPYYRWLIKHQYWEAVPVGWVGRYSKNMKIQEPSLLFQKYSHVENSRLAKGRGPKVSEKSLKSVSKVSQKSLKSPSKVCQQSLKSFSKVAQSRSKVGQNVLGQNVHHNSTVGAICPPSKSLCDLGQNVLGQNVLGAFCLGSFCPWGKMSLGQNVP